MNRHFLPGTLLASVAAPMLAPAAFGQGAPAADADAEALRNIQSNFARVTPRPRTVDSINQELRQGEVKSQPASAGRHGGRGRGRQQQAGSPSSADGGGQAADPAQAAPALAMPSAGLATPPSP